MCVGIQEVASVSGALKLLCRSTSTLKLLCRSIDTLKLLCRSIGTLKLLCRSTGTLKLLCRPADERNSSLVRTARTVSAPTQPPMQL